MYDKYSDDEQDFGGDIDFDGLKMPIQDDDYEEEDRMNDFGPIQSDDKEPDFSKMMSNGKDLSHLKLAGGKKNSG